MNDVRTRFIVIFLHDKGYIGFTKDCGQAAQSGSLWSDFGKRYLNAPRTIQSWSQRLFPPLLTYPDGEDNRCYLQQRR